MQLFLIGMSLSLSLSFSLHQILMFPSGPLFFATSSESHPPLFPPLFQVTCSSLSLSAAVPRYVRVC